MVSPRSSRACKDDNKAKLAAARESAAAYHAELLANQERLDKLPKLDNVNEWIQRQQAVFTGGDYGANEQALATLRRDAERAKAEEVATVRRVCDAEKQAALDIERGSVGTRAESELAQARQQFQTMISSQAEIIERGMTAALRDKARDRDTRILRHDGRQRS